MTLEPAKGTYDQPPNGQLPPICPKCGASLAHFLVRAGEIPLFTGIDSPYEPPLAPDVEVHTDRESVEQSLQKIADLAISLARPPEASVGEQGANI